VNAHKVKSELIKRACAAFDECGWSCDDATCAFVLKTLALHGVDCRLTDVPVSRFPISTIRQRSIPRFDGYACYVLA